ncbi:MAG: isopentenyl-diphosphate Delta-isomerase, partial [Gammaproteobacteria bacterium]
LVDEFDQPIGHAEKLFAHQQGLLHRAFSIFVLRKQNNRIEMLLQQRQKAKYHSGGLWTNSCCSHPRPNEDTLTAASKRLQEEFGFTVPLTEIGVFTYRAEFANGLIEHEVDHVFVGHFDDAITINPDPDEIMSYRWLSLEDALQDFNAHPEIYTPWFAQALEMVIQYCK